MSSCTDFTPGSIFLCVASGVASLMYPVRHRRRCRRPYESPIVPPPRLFAIGPNPAWQKVLAFSSLALDRVNRACSLRESGGGKGINFARAARCLGFPVTAAFFAGGDTGRRLVEHVATLGIDTLAVSTQESTRVCSTLLCAESETVTELIEPSPRITAAEEASLAARIREVLPVHDGVALCGTCPPGVAPSFYADVVRICRERGIPVLLDGVRDVGPALSAGVDILKINAEELFRLSPGSDVPSAAAALASRHPVGWIGVTDGPRPAHLVSRGEAWRFDVPGDEPIRNSIGAGDAASAAFLGTLVCQPGASVPDAFATALAAALASCAEELPSVVDPAVVTRLLPRISRERL